MAERISLRCRSCNGHTIFIGKGGHLTCSYIDCKEPSIERQIAQLGEENKRLKDLSQTVADDWLGDKTPEELSKEWLGMWILINYIRNGNAWYEDYLDSLKESD